MLQLRNQITCFRWNDGEPIFEAWDQFKDMMRKCPHQGLEKWLIVHTLYNGVLYTMRMTLDVATGGTLLNKHYHEAYSLIEDMAQNHYH